MLALGGLMHCCVVRAFAVCLSNPSRLLLVRHTLSPLFSTTCLPAVEEGIEVCKRLGLPKDDDTYAGLEALQEGLQTLLKDAAAQQAGKKDN